MVSKFFSLKFSRRSGIPPSGKNSQQGITLIEIIVVFFIIGIFSVILISDFPKIQRQFALSRATYKLAQDLRKTQDLGLSGIETKDSDGLEIKAKGGYGMYVYIESAPLQTEKYILYADVDGNGDYDGGLAYEDNLCVEKVDPAIDCVIEIINVKDTNPSLYIKETEHTSSAGLSINFSPPNPIITINNMAVGNSVGIVLGLNADSSAERTVWINKSGLITVQ